MDKDKLFLHYYFRLAGIILVTAGIILGLAYLLFRFNITIPVFAVASAYLEAKFFTTFRTNVSEELIMLSLLAGLFFIAFSKDKNGQNPDELQRSKAFINAVFYNTLFLAFSIIFLYGQIFLAILALNMISLFVLYLIFYRIFKHREKNKGNFNKE